MESLGNLPDRYLAEIVGQPKAMRRAGQGLADQADALERVRRAAGGRPVVFTGMGASYDACYAPASYLGGAGVLAWMVDAAELLHFRRQALAGALLVAVSQSGESAEVVRLVEALHDTAEPAFVVSVSNGLGNALARSADVALDTRAGEEVGPSTMTFVASLVVLSALSNAIGARGEMGPLIEGVASEAEAAAGSADDLLSDAASLADRMARWLGHRSVFSLLGRGTARAASEMAALTLKEAARFPAEAVETAQFRHGPLELAGPDAAVAIVATEPATRGLDLGLAEELVDAGSAVLAITDDGSGPAGAEAVAIGRLGRLIAPACALIPLQLLSWRLAQDRGRRPGVFTHATKVTTRE
jgi:glucosamine--fructose-6-phosphate aminotransferase (isomerizing)